MNSIKKMCEYRGLPLIKIGDTCTVNGRAGVVVGSNRSANLDVKFNDDDSVGNCHPSWKLKIFNGNILIYDSEKVFDTFESMAC